MQIQFGGNYTSGYFQSQSKGGFIYIEDFNKTTVDNCNFSNAGATSGQGGIMHLSTIRELSITNSSFTASSAAKGGLISLDKVETSVTVNSCEFLQGTSTQ